MDAENPFQSPRLEATDYSPHRPDGSLVRSMLAVILGGAVVDYLGTQVVNYTLAYGVLGSADPYQIRGAFQPSPVWIVMMFSGVACSFFGGMLAAWVARRRHVLHAVLSVVLAHVLVLPQFLFTNRLAQPTMTLALMGTCFAAAAFGGRMCAPSKPLTSDEEDLA